MQPSDIVQLVCGTFAPVPYACLTKQRARDYAAGFWRGMDQETKSELCRHLFRINVNPRRLNALDSQELCFELIVFMVSADMENDFRQEGFVPCPGENSIPGEGVVALGPAHVQQNVE